VGIVLRIEDGRLLQSGSGLVSASEAFSLETFTQLAEKFFALNSSLALALVDESDAKTSAKITSHKAKLIVENRKLLTALDTKVQSALIEYQRVLKDELGKALRAAFTEQTAMLLLADVIHKALPDLVSDADVRVGTHPEQSAACFDALKKLSVTDEEISRLSKVTLSEDPAIAANTVVVKAHKETYLLEARAVLDQFLARLNVVDAA
jgi:hypothetical protein